MGCEVAWCVCESEGKKTTAPPPPPPQHSLSLTHRCAFSACATSTPLTTMSATVSTPDATRSTCGEGGKEEGWCVCGVRKKIITYLLSQQPTHVGVGQQVGRHVELAGEVPGVQGDPAVLELVVAVWGGRARVRGEAREPGARARPRVCVSLSARSWPSLPASCCLPPRSHSRAIIFTDWHCSWWPQPREWGPRTLCACALRMWLF